MNDSTSGFTTTSYDWGDNIVYPRVRLYAYNNLQTVARCQKKVWWGWQDTGYAEFPSKIYPTATGQTFWIG